MTTTIVEFEKPKLKDPLFIEGLPGVGNVGRIAAGYLVEELKATKFADVLSSHFMPFVLMHQSSAVHLLKNEFYYLKGKKKGQRDLIILIGDSQSISPEGHYEVVVEILKYVKGLGVKEMFTLAGVGVGEQVNKPKVIGAVSENGTDLIKKYKNKGVDFDSGSKIGTIGGASGLLLGMGAYYGIKGACLLGETPGLPIIPDPRSAEEILKVLNKILNLKVDMSKLDKKVKETEEFVKKIQNIEKQTVQQMMRAQAGAGGKQEDEKLTYIG